MPLESIDLIKIGDSKIHIIKGESKDGHTYKFACGKTDKLDPVDPKTIVFVHGAADDVIIKHAVCGNCLNNKYTASQIRDAYLKLATEIRF